MSNHAVFIDRDGTIAHDVPYCSRPEDFVLFPGVAMALRMLNEAGLKVVVITNQSGVGRGYFTENKLREIHEKMMADLAMSGARLDGIYYCPHHPRDNCECRKPKTLMFRKAADDLSIDLSRSFMIGDKELDIQAGSAAQCKTILITGNPLETQHWHIQPSYIAANFAMAVDWILNKAISA